MADTTKTLPPLPEPDGWIYDGHPDGLQFKRQALTGIEALVRSSAPMFTAHQMRAYAAAALAAQAQPTEASDPAWRELCRRLYVELWHCDQQLCSLTDDDGDEIVTQGSTVRDVLADARSALESPATAPTPTEPRRVYLVCTGEMHEGEVTYTRHDDAQPPMCDAECLYTAPPAAQAQGEPMNMALCEAHSVVLRVGQPYTFRPVGDCETCRRMADQAREAYGESMGFTDDQPAAQPVADELRIARGAIRELEAKVFSQEQALAVLRTSVDSYHRDMADPPGYLQDAVIKAAGLGATAEQIAALKKAQPVRQPLTREQVRDIMDANGYAMASPQERSDFINGLRHGESAHGIGQEGGAA